MRTAGYVLLFSAVLHLVAVAASGFAAQALFLLAPAALYVVLSAGLARGMLWVAWIAFIAMLGGTAGAIVELNADSILPDWPFWGILAADILAAALLFFTIWRGQPLRQST
jgi:hypothetical protein